MRRLTALLLALVCLLSCAITVNAAGSGHWVMESGKRSFLNGEGQKLTGWQNVNGGRYYFGDDGIMRTGWQILNGDRYYLGEGGVMRTGWQDVNGGRYYFGDDGVMRSGFVTVDGKTYYLGEGGVMRTGWRVVDGKRYCFGEDGAQCVGKTEYQGFTYFFNEDGSLYTGWLKTEEGEYYFLEDGTMAIGEVEIDGVSRFFCADGKQLILVNPWNSRPEDYQLDLVKYGSHRVDSSCLEALRQMIQDCKAAGRGVKIISTYRTNAQQTIVFNRMVNRYLKKGYSYENARKKAGTIAAVPGTSEHQLGVAADIVDASYTDLDYKQAKMPTQKWLMENCWKYGFILRYPPSKRNITGIVYEPWHYRYVGLELAKELTEREICLEEYFAELTQQQAEKRATMQ